MAAAFAGQQTSMRRSTVQMAFLICVSMTHSPVVFQADPLPQR
jgi:hypothetical protein